MANDADAVIRSELANDERLLWSGRPGTGFRFQPGDWILVPFGLVWTGLVGFSSIASRDAHGASSSLFAAVLFLIVGSYILIGRYVLDSLVRLHTRYGLTGQRALIVRDWFGIRLQTVSLVTLTDFTLTASANGSGTIFLGSETAWLNTSWLNFFSFSFALHAPAFAMIDDAKSVCDLLRQAQKAAQDFRVAR